MTRMTTLPARGTVGLLTGLAPAVSGCGGAPLAKRLAMLLTANN